MTFQQQSTEAKRESFPRTIPFYEDTTPGRQIWGFFFSVFCCSVHTALCSFLFLPSQGLGKCLWIVHSRGFVQNSSKGAECYSQLRAPSRECEEIQQVSQHCKTIPPSPPLQELLNQAKLGARRRQMCRKFYK